MRLAVAGRPNLASFASDPFKVREVSNGSRRSLNWVAFPKKIPMVRVVLRAAASSLRMRYAIVSFSLLLAPLAVAASEPSAHPEYVFSLPPGWKADREFKRAQSAWYDADSRATLVVQSTTGSEAYVIDSGGITEAFGLLAKIRGLATRFLGVEGWKAHAPVLTKTSSGQILKFRGQYRGPGGHLVRFHEWQFLFGRKYFQVNYAEDGNEKRSEAEIEALLARFSSVGWKTETAGTFRFSDRASVMARASGDGSRRSRGLGLYDAGGTNTLPQ